MSLDTIRNWYVKASVLPVIPSLETARRVSTELSAVLAGALSYSKYSEQIIHRIRALFSAVLCCWTSQMQRMLKTKGTKKQTCNEVQSVLGCTAV
jgi:hypothetical protein